MSVIKVNNITSRDGTTGPVFAGITTVSSTSHLVVPTGNTGQKTALAPDPFIDNLVLALPFNSESVFNDVSPTNKGTPYIAGLGATTASLPYGVSGVTTTSAGIVTFSYYYGTSCYFNGTSTYLGLGANSQADYAFGSSDFTVEAWVYRLNTNTAVILMGQTDLASNAGSSYVFYVSGSSTSDLYIGTTSFSVTSPNPTVNQWAHVAWTRSGGTFRSFLNGVIVGTNTSVGSGSVNTGSTTYQANIGGISPLTGYLQDLRIYKGVAKYTSNFTPPTQIAL